MDSPVRRTLGRDRRLTFLVIVVVAADWFTKFIVSNRIALYQKVEIIGHWLTVVRVRNEGIAFSLFGDTAHPWRLPLLVALGIVALLTLARYARGSHSPVIRVGLALIFGGALGNLGDRMLNGGVTDFLLVSFLPFIFNLADVSVVAGGILLAFGGLTREQGPIPSTVNQ